MVVSLHPEFEADIKQKGANFSQLMAPQPQVVDDQLVVRKLLVDGKNRGL